MSSMATDSSSPMISDRAKRMLVLIILRLARYASRSSVAVSLVRCASCLRSECVVVVDDVKCSRMHASSFRGVTSVSTYNENFMWSVMMFIMAMRMNANLRLVTGYWGLASDGGAVLLSRAGSMFLMIGMLWKVCGVVRCGRATQCGGDVP